jgi:rhodanese-related sulfurtransferase
MVEVDLGKNVHHAGSHVPKARNASHGHSVSYRTFDASYILYCKSGHVVASNVAPKCKKGKTCIWVPKSYVTNLTGPNTSWVSKPQA